MSKPGNEVSKYRWMVLTILIACGAWTTGVICGFIVGCL